MNNKQDIKFQVFKASSKLTDTKVCYQGTIIYNQKLDSHETRKRFAEYMNRPEPEANLAIDSVVGFIAQELARGNHIDFGSFSVGMRVRGGFPAANAAFDPQMNSLMVELMPKKSLKKAVQALNPVNATVLERIRISNVMQTEPCESSDAISATGPRMITVYGENVLIHPKAKGEGIWIENDAGERLLTGVFLSGDVTRCRVRLTGDIPAGSYWLVVSSRPASADELLRAQRRITAV